MATRDDLSELRLEPHEKRVTTNRWLAIIASCAIAAAVGLAGMWAAGFQIVGGLPADGKSEPESSNNPQRAASAERPDKSASEADSIAAGGYVEARRVATVRPAREGVVREVYVVRGQRVKKGTLLLELDSDEAEAEVAMAEADLARAKARFQGVEEGSRKEEIEAAHAEVKVAEAELEDARHDLQRVAQLSARKAISDADVDDARYRVQSASAKLEEKRARERLTRKGNRESDLLQARAEVERAAAALGQANVRLEQLRLRAPFDGIVTRVDLEPGETVSMTRFEEGKTGVEIADVSQMRVKVDVPESRIQWVAAGDQAEVVINALGRQCLRGKVIEIAPRADRQSNTVEVVVQILDPPPLVRPDMSARVAIMVKKESANERSGGR